jgi:CheY-like chemotaxis protein
MTSGRKKILLVDDNAEFVTQATKLLRKLGVAKVLVADSGAEAIGMMKILVPDAVMLDMDMPDEDGFQTLTKMRANKRTAKVPVVLVGARNATEKDFQRCRGLDVAAEIRKPLKSRELDAALQDCAQCYGSERRRHMRVRYRGRVVVISGADVQVCEGVTLSEGGVLVKEDPPLPLKTPVDVIVTLRESTVQLPGHVIYHQDVPVPRSKKTASAMCIEFGKHPRGVKKALQDFVTSLAEE